MSRNATKDLTTGSPMKLILGFGIPLLFGMLFQQFYNMMDTIIVGKFLGVSALASVGATGSINFMIIGFCMGVCNGFAIPVAQRFGAKDEHGMRKFVANSVWLSIIFAVVMAVLVCVFCRQILELMNTPEDIIDGSYSYIFVIFLGIPATYMYNLLSGIMRSLGDSKTPLYLLIFSSILNIILDLLSIIVLKMGVAGAAWATVIAQAVSGFCCLGVIWKKFPILHVQREEWQPDKLCILNLCNMGIPMGLQFSITAIGSMTMQSANNSLGTIYVSGFTAGLKIKQLMMCPFDAIGATASTFLSQNYGAKKTDRIRQGFKISVALGTLYACVAAIIMIFLGRMMSMMFVSSSEAAVLDASALYLRRMGYFFPVVSLVIVMRMSIQGLGYSGRAMFGGILEMFARSFVAMVFVPMFKFDAITWTDQAAWVVAAVYLGYTSYAVMKHVEQQIQIDLALEK